MRASNLAPFLVSASIVAMLFATPVFAADQPVQAAAEAGNGGVEEIVVTAQRRSENILNVPLAISASSGAQLQSQGIKQISDLAFTTPGYNVSEGSGYTQIFIRGVGNAIFVGADPSVATFIDDVPRIYGSMVNDFVDVDRVEVLKGAQGGLYGRNATGGVINIITKQPSTDEVKGDMRVSYGTKHTLEAAAYLNLPINDKVAFSIAGERRSHSAYDKNLAVANPYNASMFPTNTSVGTPAQTAAFLNSGVDNRDVGNENFWAGNAKLLMKPSDNLKITLAGDYNFENDRNGNQIVDLTPAYQQYFLQQTLQTFLGAPVNLPAGFLKGREGQYEATIGTAGFVKNVDYGVSGTVVWSLPGVDLTSISAYRNQHTYFTDDLNGSTVPYEAAVVNNHKHYAYQELRAASTFDGPLHLIGGATYLSTYFHAHTLFNELTPIFTNFEVSLGSDRVKNYSIYGQAAYDFTDHITLTASGRYVHETNKALFEPIPSFPDGTATASSIEHKFLPSATLSYKLDGGGNIYVRWARGFKSGGVNPVSDIRSFEGNPNLGAVFKGETVDTYETGYRGSLFDHKVQITTALFYNNYKNLQTLAHANAAHSSILEAIINAGTARTYGAEGSVTWRVVSPLTVGINAGYLNAKYKHFVNTDSTVLVPFDLSHTQMINSPKFQISYVGNLDLPVNKDFRLVGSLLVQHTSSVLYGISGDPTGVPAAGVGPLPPAVGKPYWLANARIGVRTTDDKYEFAIYAKNLFNNAYYTYGNSEAGGSTELLWGEPRIIGAEASVKF